MAGRHTDRLVYFAFDLIYAEGHDLQRCPIDHRKALLKEVFDNVGCERIVYVDHIIGDGDRLFERVRAVGAEGVVSKRLGGSYRHGNWLKTKCHQVGRFIITGFRELGEGRLEGIHVAEEIGGKYIAAGQIRFGFAGKGLWSVLDQLRSDEPAKSVVPVRPTMMAEIKYYGRHKGRSIRDGVLLDLIESRVGARMAMEPERRLWVATVMPQRSGGDVYRVVGKAIGRSSRSNFSGYSYR